MGSQSYRVLLVDDSVEDRLAFRRFLERDSELSFTCYESASVAEAQAACRELQPDAVLLDYHLPDDEGLVLLSALIDEYGINAFAMLLITGSGNEQLAVAAMKLGAHDYLVKGPLIQHQLGRAVAGAIERARLQRTLARQHRELEVSNIRLQQALASVSEQRRFLNVTLANIGDGVISVDAKGVVAFLNPEAGRLTGWACDEAQGLPAASVFQIADEETRAPITMSVADLLRGQVAAPTSTYVLRAHNGRETPIDLNITPIQQAGGTIEGAVIVFRDISAQKQAEALLRTERDRFMKLAETVPGVVHAFRLWPDGRSDFPYASPRIAEIYGLTPETLAQDASGVSSIWHPADTERLFASLRQSHEQVTPWHEEFRVLNPDRGEIWVEGHSIPQRQADGSVIWYGVLADITARKHAEETSRRAAERLRALADASRAFAEAVADYEKLLGQIARISAEQLDTSCMITMLSDDREWLVPATFYDCDSDILALLQQVYSGVRIHINAPNAMAAVVRQKQAILVPKIDHTAIRSTMPDEQWALFEIFHAHSSIIVPLQAQGQVFGSISLMRTQPNQPPFGENDLVLAQDLADRAGLAIASARLLAQIQAELAERARAEAAAQERERKLSTLLDMLPIGISILDAERNLIYANPALKHITILSDSLLRSMAYQQRRYLNAAGEPLAPDSFASVRAYREHQPVYNVETGVVKEDGSQIWLDVSAVPVDFPDWKVVVTTADITERKQINLALQASELRRALALEAGQLGTWEWNPMAHTIELDPTCMRLFGLTPETFTGDEGQIFARVHPDDLADTRDAMQAGIERGGAYNPQFRWRLPDGSWRWLQGIGKASHASDGEFVGFYGIIADITERKQIEHERERARQRSQVLADASRSFAEASANEQALLDYMVHTVAEQLQALCIVRFLSDDGEWLEVVNFHHTDPSIGVAMQKSALAASLRVTDPAPPAMAFRTGQALLLTDIQLADTSDTPIPEELLAFWRDFHINSIIAVVLRAQGTSIGTLALLRMSSDLPEFDENDLALVQDLADRAAMAIANARLLQQLAAERATLARRVEERTADLSIANAKLARTARLKDEFLASMSHELRTPLNSILGRSEALQEEIYGALNPRQIDALQGIEGSGRHLLTLINDILDLSKIEADKLDLQIEPVAIAPIYRSALQMVSQTARQKRISLSSTIDALVETLPADARRLKQVLVNLLSNAVKFTPEGGKVGLEVQGDAENQTVIFTVWDTGIGIAEEHMALLFKPFMQIDSRLSRQYEGTGLGLALVLRLVQAHGGSVVVTSTPGQGSRFNVTLPWNPQHTVEAIPDMNGAEDAPGATLRTVLVIEDSLSAGEQIGRYLSELGIAAVIHTQASGAIARAAELMPDLIVLDILLPDGTGWDLFHQLNANRRTEAIPVLITSVVDDPERARALGAAGFLLKPIDRAILVQTLQRIVRAASQPSDRPDLLDVSSAAQPGTEPIRILLAEDNESTIDIMSDYLHAKGYEVIVARNGGEAFLQAQDTKPALILMDIQMPGVDGLEAIRRIRADEALYETPIIAVTALAMPGDREHCLAAGANDYLTKPVNLRALLTTIQSHTQRVPRPS